MVITSTLPEDYDSNTLAVRSSLQSVRFYINGKLRSEYDTKDTRLAGKNSASRYVFCKTSDADAGKELRIELRTNTKQYSGVVNTVYCGDKIDIWEFLFTQYGMETIIAFFLLFASVITIIFSIMLGLIYHTKFDMEYLGWCMIMGATWMLGESKIRQLLIPNSSALASLCFVMILLCTHSPSALCRQCTARTSPQTLSYCNRNLPAEFYSQCSILAIANIADYIETLPLGQIILIGTFVMVFIHLCLYIRHRKKASDHLLLLAHLLVLLCVAAECVSAIFCRISVRSFIGIGMLILFSFKCASHRRKYTYDGTPASEKRTGQTETSD